MKLLSTKQCFSVVCLSNVFQNWQPTRKLEDGYIFCGVPCAVSTLNPSPFARSHVIGRRNKRTNNKAMHHRHENNGAAGCYRTGADILPRQRQLKHHLQIKIHVILSTMWLFQPVRLASIRGDSVLSVHWHGTSASASSVKICQVT